jgi:hypothetical protein
MTLWAVNAIQAAIRARKNRVQDKRFHGKSIIWVSNNPDKRRNIKANGNYTPCLGIN